MKCLMCESLSLKHICSSCIELFLTPSLYKRSLSNGIQVISFYKYSEIKRLLHTKHTDLGFYIYKILADLSFKKFAQEFQYEKELVTIAIDDNVKGDYSHTAILNKSLESSHLKPLFNKLRAQNEISYSGKTKQFRLLNPRDFEFKSFEERSVVLVDDIVTTGSTLSQAIEVLQRENKEVLFCLTLSDVSVK